MNAYLVAAICVLGVAHVHASQGGDWAPSTADGYRQVHTAEISTSEWPVVGYVARLWSGTNPHLGRGFGYSAKRAEVNCEQRTRRESPSESARPSGDFVSVDHLGTGLLQEFEFVCALARSRLPSSVAVAPTLPDAPRGQSQSPPKQAYTPRQRTRPKVVGTGSGFMVSRSLAVTNHHVIRGCESVSVRSGGDRVEAEVLAHSEASDLAILKTATPIGVPAQIRPSALLGEEVTAAGFPLAGLLATDLIVTAGHVNALAGLGNDPTRLQISAPVQPGNSGGPLLDRAGSVVGVVVAKLDAERVSKIVGDLPQNINFAVKPEVLRMFLEANQVQFRAVSHARRVDATEVASMAKRFTVQVSCY